MRAAAAAAVWGWRAHTLDARSSVGCTVNGEHPTEIIRKINEKEIEVPQA